MDSRLFTSRFHQSLRLVQRRAHAGPPGIENTSSGPHTTYEKNHHDSAAAAIHQILPYNRWERRV